MSKERIKNLEIDSYQHIFQVITVQRCNENDEPIVWHDKEKNSYKHVDPKELAGHYTLLTLNEEWEPSQELGDVRVAGPVVGRFVCHKSITIPYTIGFSLRESLLHYLQTHEDEKLEDGTPLLQAQLAYAFSHSIDMSHAPTVEVTLFKQEPEFATIELPRLSQVRPSADRPSQGWEIIPFKE